MGLYKLFSKNVEIQYKSCLLSKAMLFTLITTALNITLPFIIAHRSRGFWLRSHTYYEQPVIRFTYEYLFLAETDDPGHPIVCGEAPLLSQNNIREEENCIQIEVKENDYNADGKNDNIELYVLLNIPIYRTITSATVILGLDYQLKGLCPLHMQSLAVTYKTFTTPPSGFTYYGDVELHQIAHLSCLRNTIDTKYNTSLLNDIKNNDNENVVDLILRNYFQRAATTQVKEMYSRSENGQTSKMKFKFHLRIPEAEIRYTPSLLQELKWAWPQYLSLVFIFYWLFNRIKSFVFNHRLLMAWKVLPWKKID